MKNKAQKAQAPSTNAADSAASAVTNAVATRGIAVWQKVQWLAYLLWGGVVLLAFEHLWHGEVVPWFPFLTAASDANATAEMLHEMSTVGVMMAVLVTAVWGLILVVSRQWEKRPVVVPFQVTAK